MLAQVKQKKTSQRWLPGLLLVACSACVDVTNDSKPTGDELDDRRSLTEEFLASVAACNHTRLETGKYLDVDLDVKDTNGETALTLAVKNASVGCVSVVRYLLVQDQATEEVDLLNITNGDGKTALELTQDCIPADSATEMGDQTPDDGDGLAEHCKLAEKASYRLMEMLLQSDEVDDPDSPAISDFFFALLQQNDDAHFAANVPLLTWLVQDLGVDPNSTRSFEVIGAASAGPQDIAAIYFALGAQPNAEGKLRLGLYLPRLGYLEALASSTTPPLKTNTEVSVEVRASHLETNPFTGTQEVIRLVGVHAVSLAYLWHSDLAGTDIELKANESVAQTDLRTRLYEACLDQDRSEESCAAELAQYEAMLGIDVSS
jgi:hypothetical protein